MSYPDTIDTFRSLVNRVGVVYVPTKTSRLYANDIVAVNNAILAIENALGTNPKGGAADVAARIYGIEYELANWSYPTFNQNTTGKSAKTDGLNTTTNTVNVSSAVKPTVGQVLTATGDSAATWQTPAGGGGVTDVSIATANGISGSSSGGATPALTIILGAITPTTVNGLALSANDTYNHIKIGTDAGKNHTTYDGRNVFIGRESGKGYVVVANNTGSQNVGVGYRALYRVKDGYNNVGLGDSAMQRLETGYENCAVGCYAGYSTDNGYYNTYIGAGAGYTMGTGYMNTYIGRNAGYDNYSGHHNICIGSWAGKFYTGHNRLYIDSQYRADNAAQIANAIIYGITAALAINQQLFINAVVLPIQAATASAPAYIKGGIYFDTSLNKLRVGGATAWETITSV